ncbi:hypothetical protein BD626DRAFT_206621 [Schizophyllum amplum]|uniref:Uncharacterized protein n=1 Tax=Schizophyllum amplum TaxID=97359 RepID=A0A550BZD4_9AGAR|nr:hypothetical protein BD626DRAFT_206621 [Auriculariopsis ampla]
MFLRLNFVNRVYVALGGLVVVLLTASFTPDTHRRHGVDRFLRVHASVLSLNARTASTSAHRQYLIASERGRMVELRRLGRQIRYAVCPLSRLLLTTRSSS